MVEYITYKEKKYPVRISYKVLKHLSGEKGSDLKSLLDGSIEEYEPILFYALQSGAKAMDQDFSFEREQMEDILDECFWEFSEIVPKFFPKSTIEEAKKKINRK